MKPFLVFILALHLFSCNLNPSVSKDIDLRSTNNCPSLIILGTIQDAGSPHIGCKKPCCKNLFDHPENRGYVVSLGIVDPENKKNYLIECTPDFPMQSKWLKKFSSFSETELPDAIFLTHAHIGHYSGLMYLGKEAINASSIPVYAMPRMKTFLENNGPWSQLVSQKNILINPLLNNQAIKLSSSISVTPVQVPHRDEFSETVGFIIRGTNKRVLFIPDIDKWEKWESDIIKMIADVDIAFIDGTFYNGEEINTRNISEIPHPFISESIMLFDSLSSKEKNKIHFIHFNHTNRVIDSSSAEYKSVIKNGFHIAHLNQTFPL